MGNFGVGGDSGAWVIENGQGRVCGHVLAWSSKNSLAYICPMEVLLEDIAQTLKVQRVALPGEDAVSSGSKRFVLVHKERASPVMPDMARLNLSSTSETGTSRSDSVVEPTRIKDVNPSMARRRYPMQETPKVAS